MTRRNLFLPLVVWWVCFHATGTAQVLRGGAFNSVGCDCRSARRNSSAPGAGGSANTIGFRVLLSGP